MKTPTSSEPNSPEKLAHKCQLAEEYGQRDLIYLEFAREPVLATAATYSPIGPEVRERKIRRDLWRYSAPLKPETIARKGNAKAGEIVYRRAMKIMARQMRDCGLTLRYSKMTEQTPEPYRNGLVAIVTTFAVWTEAS